ncbi:MAG: NAD-dependent protein deacylase [Alphaproteobacteria bacterium]|nr:NAD-dependent protein deacylase [Alphaproteobacteria bacterium]
MTGSIVILTGAGISKESGLSTFRDPDGIWAQVRIEDVATPQAFVRDEERVHAFYNARRKALLDPAIAPNDAHVALAILESNWQGGEVTLVTQNVDDLHERAGSQNIIHIHGELLKARCMACRAVAEIRGDMTPVSRCPVCQERGSLRPHVVWFGEEPMQMDEVHGKVSACALFVSIGTSGNVYPAAGLVEIAREAGARTVELNLEPSAGASLFDETRYGKASEIVPVFVARILGVA